MDFRLMTIEEAASELHNGIPATALHKARRNGKLWAKRIGKRFYTNEQALKEFLACPDTESPLASTSETTNSNGSFVTEAPRSGQDLALASLRRLKTHSPNTSRESKSQPGAGRLTRES